MPEHAWDAHPWIWDEPSHMKQKIHILPWGSSAPSTLTTNLAYVREVSVPQTAIAAAAESHDYPPVWKSRKKSCYWHT